MLLSLPNRQEQTEGGRGMGRPSCVQQHAQGSHAQRTRLRLSGPKGTAVSRGGKIRGRSGVAPGAIGSDGDA
jgi:hypothetical protein